MKVKDYYNDFVLFQKWGLQVHTYFIDENDPLVKPVYYDSFFYEYSVPVVQRCKYWDKNVNHIKSIGDRIILDINDYIFKKGVQYD